MRALPLCLLTASMTLSGCSLLHREAAPITPATADKTPETVTTPRAAAVRQPTIALYENAEALLGKPFRDLGEVSGSVCQSRPHHTPPSLSTAKKRMLHKAAQLKANAVLLHSCQLLEQANGCYRQALCTGSALNITSSAQ
ncbi:outer membrane lipoprotein [Edwardsiella tarda]|uniref:Rcs stress response system protein RcsF n=1 Tax=Edwardsiella tarda ATCC 15947 = NBRC 105688 TaxID=667121 RepID=A0AC61TG99_EDWTA|nr:Rcs stress response system protein RcsF [Edwardsiella tarda]UAL57229.1 Rcs stress response system protein RcsF [Edwardsiella tarda]UCP99719.1 Rcs stress response system protein RcsF [Edwardsiella tarda ATCC 15947 = NBRC 105688]STD30772.1 outer membrane lipoprotein [Edwardsiella tarda]